MLGRIIRWMDRDVAHQSALKLDCAAFMAADDCRLWRNLHQLFLCSQLQGSDAMLQGFGCGIAGSGRGLCSLPRSYSGSEPLLERDRCGPALRSGCIRAIYRLFEILYSTQQRVQELQRQLTVDAHVSHAFSSRQKLQGEAGAPGLAPTKRCRGPGAACRQPARSCSWHAP